MKNLILKIFFVLGLAVFAAMGFVQAQEDYEIPNMESFEVNFLPEYPGANTKVSGRVISYTFDVNRSEIAWLIGGKVVGAGKSFSFTTGDIGSELTLKVSVITEDEIPLSKSFTFRISEADLLWETPGYAPAQYRGKILPVAQSFIKITAVPYGFSVASSRLIYEWKRDYKNQPDSSGPGKRTFSFYGAETGPEIIQVKISSPDKTSVASKSIQIPIAEPKILFYEEHPLEGPLYQKELGTDFSLNKSELILRAEPYFFSKRGLPVLSYEWQMNDKKIETPQKPNLLNLAVPRGQKGTSIINLTLENLKNILERANKTIQINFNF